MATPLYKKMKRGTSFYSFPSAIHDLNKVNDTFKMTFSKYALLNIPEQKVELIGVDRDQTKGILNFDKDKNGPLFYNFQPSANNDLPIKFSDQLIESLRNYVSNYDTTLRESRINTNTDFYNVNELSTQSEKIFWKWCRKLNIIDFEPAEHQIDWDKNGTDFENRNGNDNSFFQKYLWKEREFKEYNCTVSDQGLKTDITIQGIAKFKKGDIINFSGTTSDIINTTLSGGTDYILTNVVYNENDTVLTIDKTSNGTDTTIVWLKYHRLIECVGDIQSVSQVQTSRHNFTEVSIQIPHHAGATPTILFDIDDNTNYYPGLEMPILPQEQQVEINGAENTNSPIRIHPENYPGTHFGYFDTEDKTYKCSFGDRNRKSGEYYGILKTDNVGLSENDYKENLNDFNSDNIDGINIDFNQEHYLKMNLPEYMINNFDEFNSAYFDEPPKDYFFNAILWYYDLDDGSGKITTNLFGIEFLNDPSDDMDDCDINDRLITPYRKLVSNGEQDGYSYIFDFNLNEIVDNDSLPLSYDPTTINNQFSFDLYQNILQSNSLLYESFINIVSGYTDIQEDLYELRSMIMSDTDINNIKNQIENLNDLLKLYSTMQIVDSDTISIETLFTDTYPTLKLNMINTEYNNMIDIQITDIFEYIDSNPNTSYTIPVKQSNKTMLNIYNNNNIFNGGSKITLNQDLKYMQSMEINIYPHQSEKITDLDIFLNYSNNGIITEEKIISTKTPTDLSFYDVNNPENSIYVNSFFTNENISTYSTTITSNTNNTILNLITPLFDIDDYIYIDNFYLQSGTTYIDKSGVYKIITHSATAIEIELNTVGMILKGTLKLSYYKGMKYTILRVNQSESSLIDDRYKITKELL
jgi:hypothetical protein